MEKGTEARQRKREQVELPSAPLLPSAPSSLWLLPPHWLTLTAVCVAFVVCVQVALTAAHSLARCSQPLPPPSSDSSSRPRIRSHIRPTSTSSMSDEKRNTPAKAGEVNASQEEKSRGAASGSTRGQLEPAAAAAQSTASRHKRGLVTLDAPVCSSSERTSSKHEATAVTQASGAAGEVAAWGALSGSSQPVLSSGGNEQPPAALSDLALRTPAIAQTLRQTCRNASQPRAQVELAMKPQPARAAPQHWCRLQVAPPHPRLLHLASLSPSARSPRHLGACSARAMASVGPHWNQSDS